MFVHLHLHTEFSLVDSLIRIEAAATKRQGANVRSLTDQAARLGLPAIAVTDQDNLFGMVKFYKLAWDAVGSEFASRHQQYEMFYAGATFVTKGHSFRTYDWSAASALVEGMLDTYDLDTPHQPARDAAEEPAQAA